MAVTRRFNGVTYELYDAFRSRDSAIGNGQYYKDNGYLVRVYVHKNAPEGSLKYELYIRPKNRAVHNKHRLTYNPFG